MTALPHAAGRTLGRFLVVLTCSLIAHQYAGAGSPLQPGPLSSPGTLRERVPDNAVAYARVPGPWDLLMSLEGPSLGRAFNHPAMQAALSRLRTAIGGELASIEDNEGAIFELLFAHLRSPLEAVVLMVPLGERKQPIGFITAQLDLDTHQKVNALLGDIANTLPSVNVLVELADGELGIVSVGGLAVALHFEPSNRVLSLTVGAGVSKSRVQQLLRMPKRSNGPIAALEAEVDTSGQGLFVWVNAQQAMPFLQLVMAPRDLLALQSWGLLETRAVALGVGSVNGKGQVRLVLDVPRSGLLELVPTTFTSARVHASGEPGLVGVISGLDVDIVDRLERILIESGQAKTVKKFREFRAELAKDFGVDVITEVVASLGPEFVFFSDQAGDFLAVKLRDHARFLALISQLGSLPAARHRIRTLGSGQINHLTLDIPASTESQRFDDVVLERWFARGRTTHLYWIDEPDYLVLSSVPQALMDRMNATERVSIADWLVRNEGGPIANSAALLSLRMDNIPRLSYHYMLQGLQFLSDLSSADIDLFTLPSAGELELPPDGALGWRLELGAERIAVQMSYDGTPLDLLGSQGGFAAAAALGIVAAVAIPAYQDYTVRARVQTAYSSVLEALERQHRTTGTLPGSGAQLELNPTADAIIAELHIARTGDIHLKLRGPDGIEGQLMQLRPILRNGQFSGLKCMGDDLLVKYQPPACR